MKTTEVMSRASLKNHNGKRIMSIDFSKLEAEDACKVLDYSKELIQRMPEKSLYTLTNVTDANFDLKLIDSLKKFSNANKPYVIAGAVIGAEGIKRTVFNSVIIFSGRSDLKSFTDKDEALSWLIMQ